MLGAISPFVEGHPYNGAGEGLSFDENRMGGPDPQSGSSSKAFLRINEALLSLVTGETKEGLSGVVNLNLHLRDARYPKIREIASLHLVSNLRILNLSYNAIEHLDGLDFCTHLTELNVAENQITSLSGLEKLHALERLNLSGNDITRISSDISSLANLVSLHLSRNKIHILEDLLHLQPLEKLQKLRLRGNPVGDTFGVQEPMNYVSFHLPRVRELDEVSLNSSAVKQRAWLRYGSANDKARGSDKENQPNARRGGSISPFSGGGGKKSSERGLSNHTGRDVSDEESFAEGSYRTPMATRSAAVSARATGSLPSHDSSASSISYAPSPARGYTVPPKLALTTSSKGALPVVSKREIDDLGGTGVSVLDDSGFGIAVTPTDTYSPGQQERKGSVLELSGSAPRHSDDHNDGSSGRKAGGRGETVLTLLQHQVDTLSSLLVQAEYEKDKLMEQLQKQRAVAETAANLEAEQQATLLADMETRVKAEVLEATEKERERREGAVRQEILQQARITADEKDRELVGVRQRLGEEEARNAELLDEIARLTAAGKAVEKGYESMRLGLQRDMDEAVSKAQQARACADETCSSLSQALKGAQEDLESERLARAKREEEFRQHVEAEEAAGRGLTETADKVNALVLEESNLDQRLQSKVQAYTELVESQASQQAEWETRHRARVEKAEYEYGSVRASVQEQERMANMIEQALEIKKEEEKRVRHALESVLRDVKTCEEKKLAVLEELAHSDECVRRVKGEKESLDSQIAILETRRKGEENKARTVREQLSDRIRDVESEVERLSKLYRELSSKVGEAESSLRDKQEELAAVSREQEQQREAWEVDLHQLRNQQAVLAEQVREEEATLQSAHAATKKAELENTRQIRAAESVLLSLRREEKDGRDCVERLRDEARGVRKELATLVQDKETQKAMFKEQERKHDLQHKAQKTEEEEVHRRLQEGKRALASDLAACQAAKELLQALADKEDGMKRSNDEIRDIAQHLAHDVDRLQKDCETWKAKADQERHALSALRTQKTVVERELRLLKEDVATSAEAVQQIKEKEEQQLKVLEEARAQETQLQDQVSLLKRRVADAERAESVLLARCDEVKRDVERSTRTKEAHAQAAHEELMQTEKLQAEKTRLRESILQLERESRHAESGHHQALLAQDKAKIGVEGVEKELCKVKGDLLSLREEKEKQERAIDNATVALRAMEVQVTEGRETLAAVERRAQREAERATQEEDRVEAKKQELSALEHQVREAQTLLSQTYDSMHVERARALKELEQFEGMKLEAQHQLYTAQKAGSLTAQQPVLVQHDSSPPANMTEREKVLVGSLPPPPVSAPVLADLGVFASISSSNHNGDTASLRDSVERLRRQSSAVLSEERGNRV